jgi:peptidyl-tRNA hydrolase, PTH1 family
LCALLFLFFLFIAVRKKQYFSMASPRKVIVGLGNSGLKFAGTRHNMGADFVANLANYLNVELMQNSSLKMLLGVANVENPIREKQEEWMLAIPTTYMNLSGEPVKKLLATFEADPDILVVVHDCLDHKLGRVAYKIGGSCRGHNGLISISDKLKTTEFGRLRFGIGRPEQKSQFAVGRYVIGKWSGEEKAVIEKCYQDSIQKILSADPKLCIFDEVDSDSI